MINFNVPPYVGKEIEYIKDVKMWKSYQLIIKAINGTIQIVE